ncbi:MAG TPA: lysylphosphatidylglycerol synthase transmembrane domain-containing protein [Nitrospira sp.]|nr:lysylphosphatidylglycerol synthase transmembrane domain-containing protein [Nitrospira sp.]
MNAKTAGKLTLTVVIVWFLLERIGAERLVTNLQRIDQGWFIWAVLCSPVIVLVSGLKWHQIIRAEAQGLTYWEAIRAFLGGVFFGLLTPGRLGEFGKVALIRQGRLALLSGIAVLERMLDVEVLVIMALWGVWGIFGPQALAVAAVIALCGAWFLASTRLRKNLLSTVLLLVPFKSKAAAVVEGINAVAPGTLAKCAGLRLLACSIDLFQFYLIANSFDSVKLLHILAVYPLIILTNLIPLTIGGIGIREAMSMYALSFFNVNPETAVSASFLLFAINTFVPGVLGGLVVARYGISMRMSTESVPSAAPQGASVKGTA